MLFNISYSPAGLVLVHRTEHDAKDEHKDHVNLRAVVHRGLEQHLGDALRDEGRHGQAHLAAEFRDGGHQLCDKLLVPVC